MMIVPLPSKEEIQASQRLLEQIEEQAKNQEKGPCLSL
jgi:hypothetical protein